MAQQAQGYAESGYTGSTPILLNTYANGTTQQRLGNYAEHTPKLDSNHAHHNMRHYTTRDNPMSMEHRFDLSNSTRRDTMGHNLVSPYYSNANPLEHLQHPVQRLNTFHSQRSPRYPDLNSGTNGEPYFGRSIQNTPMDNKIQHNHVGSIYSASRAHTFKVGKSGYENFPGLEAGVLQGLCTDQMVLARTAGQSAEQTEPLPHLETYPWGISQLEGNDLGEDIYQGRIHDPQFRQLEDDEHNLVKYSAAQVEGRLDGYGAPGSNEAGYRPRILSEADYDAIVRARLYGGVCSDYPYNDQAAQLEYIKRLFEALRNTEGVIDRPKVVQSFKDGRYSNEAMVELCWQLMLSARASQVHPLVDRSNGDGSYAKFDSFSERMESITNVIREAKSICKMLLAPNFVHRVADNPISELKRKKSNIVLNAKKTGQNKAGQKAIKEKYARETGEWLGDEDEDDEEDEEEVEDEVEERPRKRLRRGHRS